MLKVAGLDHLKTAISAHFPALGKGPLKTEPREETLKSQNLDLLSLVSAVVPKRTHPGYRRS